jgi:hypothetical protein
MLWCSCAHAIAQPSHHCIAIWKGKKITQWVLYTHLNCFFVVVVVVCATLSLSLQSLNGGESPVLLVACVTLFFIIVCVCVYAVRAHLTSFRIPHLSPSLKRSSLSDYLTTVSRWEPLESDRLSTLPSSCLSFSLSQPSSLSIVLVTSFTRHAIQRDMLHRHFSIRFFFSSYYFSA